MPNYSKFHSKALALYGNRFIYHWDTYTRLRDKMTITDTVTGITFEQIPSNHLKSLPHSVKSKKDYSNLCLSQEEALNKLTKQIKKDFGNFTYQITLSSGGTSLKAATDYRIIDPRYFLVNPNTLKYYHRNYCQKQKLVKHFQQPMLDEDTENTYMERLGFLKIYDNGLAEIQI